MSFKPNKGKLQGEDKRNFDTTSLRYSMQSNWIARDYGAHFFRWGFVRNFLRGRERVLDIGCGADQPIVRILCHHPGTQPKIMVGVDYDSVKKKWDVGWFDLMSPFDFTRPTAVSALIKKGPFDVITCFEVIEHMQKKHGKKLLRNAWELLHVDGTFLLSTPVFDGKRMAQNHIHEYYIPELQKEIEAAGFRVERRFGTFQSALMVKQLSPEHAKVWKELSAYYSNDVMACFMAPLYPDLSRNNFWVLRKR